MNEEKKKLTCEDLTEELLLDYEEGELPVHLQQVIHEHLESCSRCSVRARDIGIISTALGESRELSHDVPVPKRVDDAVFDTIKKVIGSRRKTAALSKAARWLIPFAAAFLLIVAANMLFTGSAIRLYRNPEKDFVSVDSSEAPLLKYRDEKKEAEKPGQDPMLEIVQKLEEALEREKNLKEELEEKKTGLKILTEALNNEKEKTRQLIENREKSDAEFARITEKLEDLERTLQKQDERLAVAIEKSEIQSTKISGLEKKLGEKDVMLDDLKQNYAGLDELLQKTRRENETLKKSLLVEGDLNGDGMTDVSDAMILVKKLLSDIEFEKTRANDFNNDGSVDIGDALSIVNRTLME